MANRHHRYPRYRFSPSLLACLPETGGMEPVFHGEADDGWAERPMRFKSGHGPTVLRASTKPPPKTSREQWAEATPGERADMLSWSQCVFHRENGYVRQVGTNWREIAFDHAAQVLGRPARAHELTDPEYWVGRPPAKTQDPSDG